MVAKLTKTVCSSQKLFHAFHFCWHLDEQPCKIECHKGRGLTVTAARVVVRASFDGIGCTTRRKEDHTQDDNFVHSVRSPWFGAHFGLVTAARVFLCVWMRRCGGFTLSKNASTSSRTSMT